MPTDLSTSPKPLISVALDVPMAQVLYYSWAGEKPLHGDWVLVPLGKRQMVGMVVDRQMLAQDGAESFGFNESFLGSFEPPADLAASKIRPIGPRLSIPRADRQWIALLAFASAYYRRPFGAALLSVLPKWLREPKNHRPKKEGALSLVDQMLEKMSVPLPNASCADHTDLSQPQMGDVLSLNKGSQSAVDPPLNMDQQNALAAIRVIGVHVLHGVTGSGKTRVYTEAAREILFRDTQSQVLMLVPEIGLTPQLVSRFKKALPGFEIAILHSEVSERERARLWLLIAQGKIRMVIGTRLAAMTPMPHLTLIMIDEEHDASYKQQEGMRYSARDLSVWRAHHVKASLLLGSATPSVETWAQLERGKYQHLSLPKRATGEPPAPISLVDSLKDPATGGLSSQARTRIDAVLQGGGQVLVFLNRRGYAPVLSCSSCGWASECADCKIASVLHRSEGASTPTSASKWRLQCHHCGQSSPVVRQCPQCGDTDLQPIGRGVQRLEQTLREAFPQARIMRVDRDSVRQGKLLGERIDAIDRGEVDIVVGTQMLAKGHDFARMNLVVVADADTQLLNPDFRAPERLFATLIQVAGRAGRHAGEVGAGVLVQTRYPQHRLYQYLLNQDVKGYAQAEMADRRASGLPPYAFMAALRASHTHQQTAQSALRALQAELTSACHERSMDVRIYGPVPRYPETLAGRWRGQLMIESDHRRSIHAVLSMVEDWMTSHASLDPHLDVDPIEL